MCKWILLDIITWNHIIIRQEYLKPLELCANYLSWIKEYLIYNHVQKTIKKQNLQWMQIPNLEA